MPLELSDAYYADVDVLQLRVHADEGLVFCCDANATIGTEKSHLPHQSRGPNGLNYTNAAGRRFLSWLQSNSLASASSFFESGLACNATWFHPCSRLPHLPGHIVVRTHDLKRAVKCSKLGCMLVDSDHFPLKIASP